MDQLADQLAPQSLADLERFFLKDYNDYHTLIRGAL